MAGPHEGCGLVSPPWEGPDILLSMATLQTTQYIVDWTDVVEHMVELESAFEPADEIDRKGIWMALHGMLPVDLRLKSDGTYTAYFGGDIGLLRGAWSESDSLLRLEAEPGAVLGRLPRDSKGALLLRRKGDGLLIEVPGLPGDLPVVLALASTDTLPEPPGT